MKYIKWTSEDIDGLEDQDGMTIVFTEVDADGCVLREIGLDSDGKVIHRSPSENSSYGLFDNQIIETVGLVNEVRPEEFESLWANGRSLLVPTAGTRSDTSDTS